MDKIALIYEFNNNSPLFAYAANLELENNNVDRALEILEKGLNLYPDYHAGLIIYSKALVMAGDFETGISKLHEACDIYDSGDTFNFYQQKFEKIKETNEQLSESRRAAFIPDGLEEIEEEPPLTQPEIISTEEPVKEQISEEPEIIEEPFIEKEDEIETLAKELSTAQMPHPVEDEIIEEPDDSEVIEEPEEVEEPKKEIVSETLAGIYFAQGNLEEALSLYEKLIDHHPNKEEFFKKRIKEIKELLEQGEDF